MKKLVLILSTIILIVIFSSHILFSQEGPFAPGKKMLQGGLSFISKGGELYAGYNNQRTRSYSFDPTLGYFVVKGLQVGAAMSYRGLSKGNIGYSLFGIGPQIAYYLGENNADAKGKTYPFIALSFQYFTGYEKDALATTDGTNTSSQSDVSNTTLKPTLGFTHMLTNAAGFYGAVSYYIESTKTEPKGAKSRTESSNDLQVLFGLNVFF